MARTTLSADTEPLYEAMREIAALYPVHRHKLSDHTRDRIARMVNGGDVVRFGKPVDGVILCEPSGELLAVLSDLRRVAGDAA